jgi:hypothetical protein
LRPGWAFDLKARHRQLAVFTEGKKLFAPDPGALGAGAPTHAFDLHADPREERDLARDAAWPAELARSLAGAAEPWLVPMSAARTIDLSPEQRDELQAIGYGE